MAHGEAVRQVFGAELVDKFAAIATNDALRHIVSSDYLAGAFSAAHAVRLSGQLLWTISDQEQMATALGDEVKSALQSNRAAAAASRAAAYRMLTDASPWPADQVSRMLQAVANQEARGHHPFKSIAVAEELASYLLLGGPIFWSEDDFRDMRAVLIIGVKQAIDHGRDVLAADRLAVFDIMEGALEALTT